MEYRIRQIGVREVAFIPQFRNSELEEFRNFEDLAFRAGYAMCTDLSSAKKYIDNVISNNLGEVIHEYTSK